MNTKNERVSKKAGVIKIGIDMHLSNYRVVRQIDQSNPEPAQKFKPVVFFLWLAKQLGIAEEVVVCYEAGCFGYQPARRMQKMGVKVYEIAPADHLRVVLVVDLALALFIPVLRRLSEYLAGHEKALSIVRIPLAAGGGAAGPGAAA